MYFNGSLREDLASSESLTSLSGSISGSVSEQGASLSTKPFEVNGSPETGRLKLNLNGDGRGLTEVVIPRVINSLISPQELSPGALLASGTLDEILNPEDEVDEDDKPLLDWFINRMANCHQDKPWHLYLTRLDLDSFYMGNEDIQMDFTENEDKDVIKFNANVQNFKIGAAVKFVWGEDTSGVMDTLQCHGEDWEISLDVTLQGAELSMNVNLELDQESNRLKVKNIQQFSIGMSELIINDVQEIWNTIKSKLKKNAEAKMTGNNKGLGIFNEALEKSNDEVNDTLSNMLTNVSEEDHTDSQRIEIEITSPIKCSDPCSENGNPELNQDAYIEMKTNDIINATLSIVHKNTSDLGLNTTMKTDDSNNACIIQMMGSLVCCIIILYLLISKG